jgi:putative flippase GtrA
MWRASGAAFAARLPVAVRFFLTRRFATFLVFGGLAALVNLLVGRTLYTLPAFTALLPYWGAVVIAAASGLLVNFSLNYAFNFRYEGRSAMAQLRTFTVVALGGVGLMALLASGLLSLAHWAGVEDGVTLGGWHASTRFLAHVAATGLVTFYSFAAHSAMSFNAGLRAFLVRLPALVLSPRRAA